MQSENNGRQSAEYSPNQPMYFFAKKVTHQTKSKASGNADDPSPARCKQEYFSP